MGLFSFFRGASGYVHPDPGAVQLGGENAPRSASYHKKMVWISCLCGALGATVGLAASVAIVQSAEPARGVLVAPFTFCAAGLLLGAATACLFAPREFLTGPFGKKWMKLIGTKNVLAARIACFALAAIIAGPLIGLAVLVIRD